MESFAGKIAVVTGGGTGMGRELVVQLAADGAHVAMCDVSAENMAETTSLAREGAAAGVRITSHIADVSDEAAVNAFRDAVMAEHETSHVNLVFNNAGIGGGGSFVAGERDEWEQTFDVCWYGVYFVARAFIDLLVASDEGAMINTSSVNGFWASVGPRIPHTSYSAAKFAVKGFTEALQADFEVNAPHLTAHVVMPGHIGTSIALNSGAILGTNDPVAIRKRMAMQGIATDALSDEELLERSRNWGEKFRDDAPTTAAEAAAIILNAVHAGQWRILVGEDAHDIDELVRADPEAAYLPEFMGRIRDRGHLGGLAR